MSGWTRRRPPNPRRAFGARDAVDIGSPWRALLVRVCAVDTLDQTRVTDAQLAADQSECRQRSTYASYDDFIGKFITAHTRFDGKNYALCLKAKGYTEGPAAAN